MGKNNLIKIWENNEHVSPNQKLNKEMITKYLKPKVSKASWAFTFNLATYLVALFASIVLLSMNIYGYRSNPVMLTVEIALLIISFLFLGYGAFIFMKLRDINNFTKDLQELLNEKIKFMKVHYEIWMVITAFIVWILTFGLNTLIDNQQGTYRINQVDVFVLVSIGIIIFIYIVQKISTAASLNTLKGYLSDLRANYLDQTEQIELRKKKLRWIYLIIGLIITALFILGLLKSMSLI